MLQKPLCPSLKTKRINTASLVSTNTNVRFVVTKPLVYHRGYLVSVFTVLGNHEVNDVGFDKDSLHEFMVLY